MDCVHGGCGLQLEGGLPPSHLPRPPTCVYSTPTKLILRFLKLWLQIYYQLTCPSCLFAKSSEVQGEFFAQLKSFASILIVQCYLTSRKG